MDSQFIQTANAQTNSPVWLFHIEAADSSGEADLFLTTGDADINYFKFDDAGNATPQVYECWPDLSHEGLQFQNNLEIQRPTLTLSNVSREIQAFLQSKNFLRGRVVRVIRTFRNLLTNSAACDIKRYKVNSHASNAQTVQLTLAGELDIMNKMLPNRYYYRKCGNGVVYKGRRCWVSNGDGTFSPPAGFSTDRYWFWQPLVSTGVMPMTNVNQLLQLIIHPLNMPTLNQVTDSIKFDFRVNFPGVGITDPAWLNYGVYMYFGNGISFDDVGIANYYVSLGGPIPSVNNTHSVTIPFDQFSSFSPVNTDSIRYFGIRIVRDNNPVGVTNWSFEISNVEFLMQQYSPQQATGPDECGRTLYECRRHNNVARFGGFPSVPNRAV